MTFTPSVMPVAIGPHQIDDGPIADDGPAGVLFKGVDGLAALPDRQGYAFAVSYNFDGFGEVSLWNLSLPTANEDGFYLRQKLSPTTSRILMGTWSTDLHCAFGLAHPDGFDKGLYGFVDDAG